MKLEWLREMHDTAASLKLSTFAVTLLLLFLQRVSIACYAKRCISYRNSARPSVTRWYHAKTT